MKFHAAVILAVLAVGCGPFQVVHGPESCKVAEKGTSDFDGPVRGNLFYYDSAFRAVGLTESKKGLVFAVLWASPGLVAAEVPEGAKLEVALEDGRILELKIKKAAPPVGGGSRAGVFSQWVTEADLEPKDIEAFAKSGIKSLRTTVGGTDLTQKVFDDPRARLQTLAICLAGHSG
ncbi:hypothetical protein [Polyangium sp. 6x1]|uniref:hypothetical protein n=1 Tax=Polyangium sp. 6x1 TaxID=3042689 RepID=UPI002483085B|nr:hypothetical protein [Polyangium sp. 6x1]MDI1451824.1 hypothetical protein [Polyangium sp. 6x1]